MASRSPHSSSSSHESVLCDCLLFFLHLLTKSSSKCNCEKANDRSALLLLPKDKPVPVSDDDETCVLCNAFGVFRRKVKSFAQCVCVQPDALAQSQSIPSIGYVWTGSPAPSCSFSCLSHMKTNLFKLNSSHDRVL